MAAYDDIPARNSPAPSLTDSILSRVRGAAKKERWGKTFLQIAWTAGPVTYLALQGGYYMAYGKSAPMQVFFYFAGYTVIAAVFALAVRFLYNMTRGSEKDADHRSLQRVFDLLPDRIIEVRDLQLSDLDLFGRTVLGAKYLLENPNAGAEAVATALMDLTGDKEIAAAIRDVEVYRRYGLIVRTQEKSTVLKEYLERHRDLLAATSEEVARLVWLRAAGMGPSRRLGRTRTRGFIGRVFAAAEADNLNLMSLVDVEEVCILVFELICGRRYPYFKVRYFGDRAYTEAARRLYHARREYRASVFVRNSRIRVLAERLYAAEDQPGKERGEGRAETKKGRNAIRRVLASFTQIRSARILQEMVTGAMANLLENFNPDKSGRAETRRIRTLVELYRQLRRSAARVEKNYHAFKMAWERYAEVLESRSSQVPVRLLKPGESGWGVGLQLKSIGLGSKETLPAARLIEERLEEFSLEHEESNIKTNDQKELAVSLLQILDRFIPLGEIQVQRAIESTNSAYLTSLEKDMSYTARESWGLALVSGVDSPLREGIHETLRGLIEFDQLQLREEDIPYLTERFNADPEYAKGLLFEGPKGWTPVFDLPEPAHVPSLPDYPSKAVRRSS
ncbi:hypothetical protein [Marispirochaeta sp.]|jgi:hypothetical protein|uniref:hypothetical protein n=1 Tax=Marispirochaeta sp. TaxID=2038653 RepID=UPI0029C69CD6|nr:hypothetical protein [Marispirochaeta sp.]